MRRVVVGVGAVVLVVAAGTSALRQAVWRNSRTILDQMLIDSPKSYRSHWWQARRLYQKLDRAGAEREFRLAVALFPDDAMLLADMADRYVVSHRCDEAVPLYQRSLTIAPQHRWLRGRLIRCLSRLGRLREARDEAFAARARGEPGSAEALEYLDGLIRAR
jgi:Flp pilus assembly protein TadD